VPCAPLSVKTYEELVLVASDLRWEMFTHLLPAFQLAWETRYPYYLTA
jgi:hypothetical protein